MNFTAKLFRFVTGDDGATAVEYAVMLALIIIACMASVTQMSEVTGESLQHSADSIATAMGS